MIQQVVDQIDATPELLIAVISLVVALILLKFQRRNRWRNYSGAGKRRGRFKFGGTKSLQGRSVPARNWAARPINSKNNLTSRTLLNESEKRFYGILANAFPGHYIFPQVSFNALVTHAPWISKLYWRNIVRGQFNTKYVDFVVCRGSDFETVAVVEYDGQGHFSGDDERRDEMLRSVGYRVERFTAGDTIDSVRMRIDGSAESR
jgi:hypothetical protein